MQLWSKIERPLRRYALTYNSWDRTVLKADPIFASLYRRMVGQKRLKYTVIVGRKCFLASGYLYSSNEANDVQIAHVKVLSFLL